MVKKILLGVVGFFVVIMIIGAISSGGNKTDTQQAAAMPAKQNTVVATTTSQAKPTAMPTSTPLPIDTDGALADVVAIMENANKEGGIDFFLKAEIVQSGKRLNIYVSDDWYILPGYQKERFIDTMGDNYAVIAAQHGLRQPEASEGNYPQTSFYDSHGKELGYKSTFGVDIKK
jgi:hypothetical protein